jgi:hypothetical protein
MSLGRQIKRWVTEHGRESASGLFSEAMRTGRISRDQFSIKDLAVGLMGDNWYSVMKANGYGGHRDPDGTFHGRESGDAVDASAFADITGNQLIDKVREKYQSPEFIADKLVETVTISNGNLDTQKEPFLSTIMPRDGSFANRAEYVVEQGMPYGRSEFLPNYIVMKQPVKTGLICDVTFEMIYADRTKQAIQSAESIGDALARVREYEVLKVLFGLTVNFTYKFAGNTSEYTSPTYVETNTPSTSSGGNRWQNHIDNLPLTSWDDVNIVLQKFAEMRDPATNEPVHIDPSQIFVMPKKVMTARNILHATQIRVGDGTSTSGNGNTNPTATYASNPLGAYELLTSPIAYKLASTGSTLTWPKQDYTDDGNTTTITAAQAYDLWFMGNFKKAFYWRQVYPMQTFQAPPMNPDEFNRDVVLSVKARQYGVAGVQDPRQVVRIMGGVTNFEDQTD